MRRTLEPQDQIARYRVVGPLGAGGMGEVYVAKDETLDRQVALKVLPPQLVRNEERVRRFIIEAKSASSLNHPNIVTIYEIGQDRVRVHGGEPDSESAPVHFISMELVSGETLAQKIHEEKADLRTLLGYLAQAAEGISKAHAAGIVHRDLKPGNIMVSKDGYAKVLDFGLAKLTERQGELPKDVTSAPTEMPATGEGVIMGTAAYMSPEQVQGKPVDPRSDIFSLGCVIYEAATRKRPFAADTDVEVMHRILRDRPAPVEELNPQVPADLRRIIRRCLAKNPDQRFQTMKDLAIELREAYDEFDSLPVSGQSASSLSSGALGAPVPARQWPVVAIVAVVVLGVAGLIAAAYNARGRGAPAGNEGGPSAPEMKMSVLMSRDDIGEFVISADGRYLAYVTTADEKSSLNVRQVRTGGDVRIVTPQEYLIQGVSFSPDGDYLYYLNQDPALPNYRALFQVPSLGGSPRKVFFDVDSAAAFSPDGKRICFHRGIPNLKADALVIGELQTGKERELIRVALPETFGSAPAWSPDGKRVAVSVQTIAAGIRTRIATIDVETGRQETLETEPFAGAGSVAWLPDGKALVVSANRGAEPAPQIYRVTYPGGQARRLTNDLTGYAAISVASATRSIAAMRTTSVNNVWVAPADGGKEAQPVTFATGAAGSAQEVTPLPGGDLVFAVTEGAHAYLWWAAASGSERRQLVGQGAVNFGVHYSERSGIVFTQVSEGELVPHVWRVDVDGGGLRQLTDGKGEFLTALSRDGTIALVQKTDDLTILWSLDPVAGGELKQLASGTTGEASISPDGRLIRYFDYTEVQGRIRARSVVIPVGGGEPVAKFVLPPGTTISKWSPDGKSVTYIDRNTGWNLMRQPIAGGEPAALTRFTEGVTTNFAWSRDGAKIAVVRRIGPKSVLHTLEPGKGEPKPLAEFRSGGITECGFSLDSKSVSFVYGTASKDVVLISDFQ